MRQCCSPGRCWPRLGAPSPPRCGSWGSPRPGSSIATTACSAEPVGPLLVGVDETLERRRGAQIAAKGIYRDPVRASHRHFVKASGLRWVGLMRLAPIPWAARTWALPVLTALAPSERYDRERGRRHKALTD